MDKLSPADQILLFEAIRKYYSQTDNKEIVIPMIGQWYNERSKQYLPSSEIRNICHKYYDFNKTTNHIPNSGTFQLRYE